jgi:F0F1-type ATP synthase assembly protein I
MLLQITLTKLQAEIIKAISDLTIERENEPNNNKKTNINAFKISKYINRDYKTVKKHLKNLKELL